MGARKSYPRGFICNIIDKYTNGAEIMRSIQSDFRNRIMTDIVDLVEQAANLPSGSLNNPYHAQCFAASGSIPGEDEKRIGDLYKCGFKYCLQFTEILAMEIRPIEEGDLKDILLSGRIPY